MKRDTDHQGSSSLRTTFKGCLVSLLVGIALAALALLLFEWAVDAASRPR